jgi:hypothetical protein
VSDWLHMWTHSSGWDQEVGNHSSSGARRCLGESELAFAL